MTERLGQPGRSGPVRSRLRRAHEMLYLASRGRAGHRVPGHPPMLLLYHVGARSGQRRASGLTYMPYEASFVVVGSNGGGQRNPEWVHNLRAFPDTEIQVGPRKIKVRAREPGEGERPWLWHQAARYHPAWARFQQVTPRALPIVILTPR
jgi:F420H(2)-dependent quinone reductase